jgi:hypothetical protein
MQLFSLVMSFVPNAAAACPIFGRRSLRAHCLQPPAQLGFMLPQRSLESASMQPWCRDSRQRAQLLCCCCPLSTLSFHLAQAVNRRQHRDRFELWATAQIMKRCFGILAWRLWTGMDRRIFKRPP